MRTKNRLIPIKLDGYKPLREIVFETIRHAIINQVLKPGERLTETQLADEMGVSRTPVREAIRKLELEGFVEIIPRKGVYVASISLKDIQEVFEVRSALEALAAGLAAQKITKKELEKMEEQLVKEAQETEANNLHNIVEIDTSFHEIIYQAARNERLVNFINNLQEQVHRFRSASLARPGRSRNALEEHQKMFEALAERDVKLAKELAIRHIKNAQEAMMLSLKRQGLYYKE